MIRLFDNRVLILPDPLEEKTQGGIIIPDSAKRENKKVKGTVIYHGEGHMDEKTGVLLPITVQKNDRVIFTFGVGQSMKGTDIGIEDLLLLRESDLDCIIEEPDWYIPKEMEEDFKKHSNFVIEMFSSVNSCPPIVK